MSRRKQKIERAGRINLEIYVSGRSRTFRADLGALGLNGIEADSYHNSTKITGSIKKDKLYGVVIRAQEEDPQGLKIIQHSRRERI